MNSTQDLQAGFWRWRGMGIVAALFMAAGCAAVSKRQPGPGASATPAPQVPVVVPMNIYPLPGSLDETLVFNSNSPEVVQQEGILVSTLPADSTAERAIFLDQPVSGRFTFFSHHIAKDDRPGARLLYLGLLATNRGDRPVSLRLAGGATFLSQPDALFLPLEALIPDPEGKVFAGPGDRVATELLHGRSTLAPMPFPLPPGDVRLICSWPIPTNVPIPPPVNGRSTMLRLESDGPVYLSEIALFARQLADGVFVPPTVRDFEQVLNRKTLSGPHEPASEPQEPQHPPSRGRFQYGRVAGVSRGDRWSGWLFQSNGARGLPQPGARIGFPLAAVYRNRLGTSQDQSAVLLRRYPDTAFEAHANYGVTYELQILLANPDAGSRTYTLALSHPLKVEGQAPAVTVTYLNPPNRPVMFRGPIRLDWQDENGVHQRRFIHLVIRHGQDLPPFATIQIPGQTRYDVTLTLIYPADATPPQLLTVGRL